MRIGLDVFGAERFYDGDHRGLLDLAAEADRRGVDLITTSDHLGFSRQAHAERVRDNDFPFELGQPWLEPMSLLSAVAAVTERVDLGVYVLVAPLRPALLLAKQIATLDVLSRGRTRIGVGVGWQQAEYAAAGIPFERRFGRLEETVAACRELWDAPPASFTGSGFAFDDFHSLPRPVQTRVPIIFGMAPSKRNFDRIARVGDGWTAAPADTVRLAESITLLRTCFEEQGRDPAEAEVQMMLPTARGFDAMTASAREARDLGVDTVLVRPSALDIGADDLDEFLTWTVGLDGRRD
ncbi:TIGR03619 family F420-dependent LLM class oxidoreductase [Prescottella equi]|uniref:TIGR03619 family F420-dependent LLM class oxidoreductase n=1 Tax=Rhodococcus hoagii TaxID=43767 RepID=UPI000A0FB2CA|nr:TIGR03619 family F420-dependent LLM class oxidoreductase [Prescottella equi]ORL82666.1 LLM class F420-dependent oxidoreductase [Prescottella equi]